MKPEACVSMPLAVDFGTCNTVVAVWDAVAESARLLHIPDYARTLSYRGAALPIIPSLIHYQDNWTRLVGDQVLRRDLGAAPETFRWMKRYVSNRNPGRVCVRGRMISHLDAGRDFLSDVLKSATAVVCAATGGGEEDGEVVLTVPVEAFEHYSNWLGDVVAQAGTPRFRFIDEASAAALGHGAHMQPGDSFLIFDCGGGTLDIAAVLIEGEASGAGGCRCRILGKAGADVGGVHIDGLVFEHVLSVNKRSDDDEVVRRVSNALLLECQDAKEQLSFRDRADIHVEDAVTGVVLSCALARPEFEELLDRHGVYTQVVQTLRRTMRAASELGYNEDEIKAALMVGGSSHIPSFQRLLRNEFGSRVLMENPLDAVARGAAELAAGADIYDHIQHDYAVRYVNPERGGYDYYPIVARGTHYPTLGPVACLTVKAAYEGQRHLGLALMEIGRGRADGSVAAIELVYDVAGAARVVSVTPEQDDTRHVFWMNEHAPTFLTAEPPARQDGEARFRVEFSIDGNKRLLITAYDIDAGRVTHRNYPVVKLR